VEDEINAKKNYRTVLNFYKSQSKKTKIILWSAVSGVLLLSLILALLLNKSGLVVLYSGWTGRKREKSRPG
jgi:flagellar biosynthesis/type III secretory pathway M-ring protein FliF/YscJ